MQGTLEMRGPRMNCSSFGIAPNVLSYRDDDTLRYIVVSRSRPKDNLWKT